MTSPQPRPVLVVDFGAQYAQLIARRVREADVYCEIVPSTLTPVEQMIGRRPAAIILSGGPASVYADGAPFVDPASSLPAFPSSASATASRRWRRPSVVGRPYRGCRVRADGDQVMDR